MNIYLFKKSPFKIKISFHKLIDSLEEIALSKTDYRSDYAKSLLKETESIPQLRTGIEDFSIIENNETLIKNLLADLFPASLTNNEIKAVAIPFEKFAFNHTERFNKILNDAGKFDLSIRDFNDNQFYILNCIFILNNYYKQSFDFSRPLFYDIPDANGVIKHYRILYNADFLEITPTEKALSISSEDIDLLMDNFHDINLWKEKFPLESWTLKGFVLMSLFDATKEIAISKLKSNLLKFVREKNIPEKNSKAIFRSIFKIPDLKIGIVIYNEEEQKFAKFPFKKDGFKSYILSKKKETLCENAFLGCTLSSILEEKKAFSISNVTNFGKIAGNEVFAKHLLSQNIRSFILVPVIKNNKLLGIIELVSSKIRQLNSINATNLDLILPYFTDALERYNTNFENQIEAIIQREYTSIHPSVYWKFRNEALKYFKAITEESDYVFKEIVFKEIYPLYGQIDIQGSSEHRNSTIKEDLINQLKALSDIFKTFKPNSKLPLLEQRKFEIQAYINELEIDLKANTEQEIQTYIQKEIHPILKKSHIENASQQALIEHYFDELDSKTEIFYHARKKFNSTMATINKKMAAVIDREQVNAQAIFPHYFERFKTDGIEHNLYIGESITPNQSFDLLYLNNLRLWQIQTLCEMEMEYLHLKSKLPYELDITLLILVFNSPIAIRFRMDEKRFDVDGSYNARYEVLKKRIDKANIKGTSERITEKGKITIVYSTNAEEKEYLKYIKFLQFKKILDETIEQFEVEDLQDISGLKALRVKVSDSDESIRRKKYSYQELLNELH